MLEILTPLSFIPSSIYMCVNSLTIRFIFLPLPLINVTVDMEKFTITTSLIFLPLTLVLGSIWPLLNSKSVPHIANPLPFINCSTLKFVWRPLLSISRVSLWLTLVLVIKIFLNPSTWLFIKFGLLILLNSIFP